MAKRMIDDNESTFHLRLHDEKEGLLTHTTEKCKPVTSYQRSITETASCCVIIYLRNYVTGPTFFPHHSTVSQHFLKKGWDQTGMCLKTQVNISKVVLLI